MIVSRSLPRHWVAHPSQLRWRLSLLWTMVLRELSGRYQATLLGWLWPLLVQLAQLLVFTYLFAAIFHVRLVITGVTNPTLAYGLWLFVGLLTWNAMQIGTLGAAPAILGQPNLVKRIVFPVALIPLVPVCAAFIEAGAGLLVTLALMPLVGAPYRPSLLLLPLIYVFVIIFASGLAYCFASVTVFLRDVPQILGPLFLFAFYITPVVYPSHTIPQRARFVVALNPMAVAIDAVRSAILGTAMPSTRRLLLAAAVSVAVFAIGVRVFRRLRPVFADVV
jgi:lipopolysaccharide transport system permease protein